MKKKVQQGEKNRGTVKCGAQKLTKRCEKGDRRGGTERHYLKPEGPERWQVWGERKTTALTEASLHASSIGKDVKRRKRETEETGAHKKKSKSKAGEGGEE